MNSNIVFNTALACNSAETSILSPELDTDQEILKTLVDSIVSEQFSDTALYYLAKEPISISFTSDGLYLYSSLKNGNIWVLDIKESVDYMLPTSPGNKKALKHIQITNDNRYLIGGTKGSYLRVWNLADKEDFPMDFLLKSGKVTTILISLDGAYVYVAHITGVITVWISAKFSQCSELHDHQGSVNSLCQTNSKKWLISAGEDKEIRVWNTKDNLLNSIMEGHEQAIFALEISKDDKRLFSGGEDRSIIVWNFVSKSKEFILTGHLSRIIQLKITSDNQFLFSASRDKTLRVWNINSDRMTEPIVLSHKENGIKGMALSPDNKIIACASKLGVKIWKLDNTSINYCEIDPHKAKVICVSQLKKHDFWSISTDEVRKWKYPRYAEIAQTKTQDKIMCACFSSETDEMALGFENGDVKIFDTLAKNFQMKQNYEIHNSPITCMILNSEFLISGTEIGDIIVYKFQDASKKCLNMHSLGVTCLAWFNEDSMMMSGSKDKQVCIWELAVCSFTVLPLIHFDRVLCGTVTENSCYGITGSADNTIVVWDLIDKKEKAVLKAHDMDVTQVLVYRSELVISCSMDKKLCLWSIKDHLLLSHLKLDFRPTYLGFDRLQKNLMLGGQDGRVVSLINPFGSQNPVHVVPYKYSSLFLLFVKAAIEKEIEHFDSYWKDYVVYPHLINVLNLFCYEKNAQLLVEAIKSGSKYYNSMKSGHPLTISLELQNKQCTEMIVKLLPKYLLISSPMIYQYIEPILIKLNKTSIESLGVLYQCAHTQVETRNLPEFGKLKSRSPVLIKSLSTTIYPRLFLQTSTNAMSDNEKSQESIWNNKDVEWNEQDIAFYQSKIRVPLPLGTKQSIGFLQSIILCKNEEIFRSHLLRGIIEFKWRRAYYIIFIQALFYLVFITLQLLLIFKTSINPWIWGALFIINVLFTIKEILLVKNAGKYYLKVLWNFLELFKIVLVYIYLGYAVFSNDEETRDEILLPFSIVITWIRGFGYLRLFKNTRYLMRLILEVIKDMGPFVVILLSSVLTFGVIFYDVRIADTFKIDLLKSYALSYGEFNLGDRYTGYQNSMFVIASLLNTLVLLSLIISLMGDTYDKVISIMEIAELKEFASLIMETETLLFWMRSQFPLCYLQECSLEQHNEEINLPWQGKINEIRKQVKTSDFRCKEILKDINSVNDIFQELPKAMAGKIAKLINKNKKIAEDDHDSETKLALIQIKKKLSELDSAKQEISVMTQGVSSLKTELTRRFTLYKQNP